MRTDPFHINRAVPVVDPRDNMVFVIYHLLKLSQ